MNTFSRIKKPKHSRRWRIVLIRKRGEYVGEVEAADAESAIKAAIKEFEIDDADRQRRLAAQPVE
ncbi:MAG TPA: hypothetical protein VNH80_07650 [Burkholderiales bacterium]|nr:hypothetical protein [Burkholderiales bacterium]